MKKINFFIPGSWKERKYIIKMAGKGWRLAKVNGCRYHFESMNESLTLSIDFLQKELTADEKIALKQQNVEFVARKILFYPCVVVYLYSSHLPKMIELNEQSYVELSFLKRFSDHVLNFKNIMVILMMLTWTVLLTLDGTNKVSLPLPIIQTPLITLFIIWILSSVIRYNTNKKIKFLGKKTGVFSDNWAPTRTIILRDLSQRPNIEAFSFLGKWRFITSNKHMNTFYYQLQSLYSEEEIRENLIEELKIEQHQVTVVYPLGLFPLGWFGSFLP